MLDRYDQDLLLDYLEGELDADHRAELDAMLQQDPQLAALLSEMANDRAMLRSMPESQAPAGLVHDVTQTLERRMLLDEPVDELSPIPLARGRGLTPEPTRTISWGRVVGLTGLAASVAVAAGILVITFDDPLQRVANEFATNPATAPAEAGIDNDKKSLTGLAAPLASADASAEAEDQPGLAGDRLNELARSLEATPAPSDAIANEPAEATDGSLALDRSNTDGIDAPTSQPERIADASDDTHAPPVTPPPLGPTAAISAIQPRQQLVLLTDSPEVSRDQLFAFCIDNGIAIVQADQDIHTNADRGADTAYALLINKDQLNSLVERVNYDVTLTPSRVGTASLFSNQAALLTDLSANTAAPDLIADWDGDRDLPQDEQAVRARLAQAGAPPKAQPSTDPIPQQTIQLHLPSDLGSDYANSRNADNLNAQQLQANQLEIGDDAQVPQPAPTLANANAETEPDLRPDAFTKEPATRGLLEEDKSDKPEPPTTNEKTELADLEEADTAPVPAAVTAPPIDATRGNWLSAHLPLANTTPLLLEWRNTRSLTPTNLIPLTIQRAEPEQVNTLRLRQQVELAEQRSQRADEADTETPPHTDEVPTPATQAGDTEADTEVAGQAEPDTAEAQNDATESDPTPPTPDGTDTELE